jgi:hypothetical protein
VKFVSLFHHPGIKNVQSSGWVLLRLLREEGAYAACSSDKFRSENSVSFSGINASRLGLINSVLFLVAIGLFLKKQWIDKGDSNFLIVGNYLIREGHEKDLEKF